MFLGVFVGFQFSEELHSFKFLGSVNGHIHAGFLNLLNDFLVSFSCVFVGFLSKALDVIFFSQDISFLNRSCVKVFCYF